MKICLKDFPNEIYIKLDKNYHKDLLRGLNELKLNHISKELKVSKPTVTKWKDECRYISLGNVKKIINLLKKNSGLLENKIISYGTKKSKLYIKNPNLPINDSPELREIVIHIMCDGCYNKENGYAAYYNVPKETKEEFISELKKCFGEADFKIYQDHVHFPTAIALILKSYFKIDFHSTKCRIPKEFFKGNRKQLLAVIRAAIIDEGTVDGSNIRIDSCNKEFLEDLKKICKQLNYECGKTWESKGPIFRFNILARSISKLKNDLGNLPIVNKQKLIEIAEKNQKRNWKYKLPGEVKKEIIKELIKKQMKTIELIFKIRLPKTTIGNHIRRLIKEGIVNFRIKSNDRSYYIKDYKKAKEFIKNPYKFIKSKKIDNYGLSQLRVLNMLNIKDKRYNEIEKELGFCKSATFKLISSLKNKELIEKNKEGDWCITRKGRNILSLNKEKARYYLYANVK